MSLSEVFTVAGDGQTEAATGTAVLNRMLTAGRQRRKRDTDDESFDRRMSIVRHSFGLAQGHPNCQAGKQHDDVIPDALCDDRFQSALPRQKCSRRWWSKPVNVLGAWYYLSTKAPVRLTRVYPEAPRHGCEAAGPRSGACRIRSPPAGIRGRRERPAACRVAQASSAGTPPPLQPRRRHGPGSRP